MRRQPAGEVGGVELSRSWPGTAARGVGVGGDRIPIWTEFGRDFARAAAAIGHETPAKSGGTPVTFTVLFWQNCACRHSGGSEPWSLTIHSVLVRPKVTKVIESWKFLSSTLVYWNRPEFCNIDSALYSIQHGVWLVIPYVYGVYRIIQSGANYIANIWENLKENYLDNQTDI